VIGARLAIILPPFRASSSSLHASDRSRPTSSAACKIGRRNG